METGKGERVKTAIEAAISEQATEEASRGDDPFAVTDPTREVPKGVLFNRQIHRRDLKAVRIIGAGQFGEVYFAKQRVKV